MPLVVVADIILASRPPVIEPGMVLTVLDAGVGYGKTTLLRSSCAERPDAVVWMTLDAADDDALRSWTHLATVVERLD